ncbi:MAG: hypothetical protein ACJA0V_003172 [Planctomycetota bacterium]|jgi:hypothetical protein
MPSTKFRVHPKYKTKYWVSNWSEYDRALIERGNLAIWLTPDAIGKWNAKPTRRRGGQPNYSDLAIETALTLRLLFQLPPAGPRREHVHALQGDPWRSLAYA